MNKKGKIAIITALILVAILTVVFVTAKAQKPECNDRIDNDGDGKIDLTDTGCISRGDNDESNCGDSVCEGGEVCDVCVIDCGYCPIPNSCSDTDGGITETIQGTASGYLNQQYYSNTDYCLSNSTLREYYCVGKYNYNVNVSCLGNTTYCANGACI